VKPDRAKAILDRPATLFDAALTGSDAACSHGAWMRQVELRRSRDLHYLDAAAIPPTGQQAAGDCARSIVVQQPRVWWHRPGRPRRT